MNVKLLRFGIGIMCMVIFILHGIARSIPLNTPELNISMTLLSIGMGMGIGYLTSLAVDYD